MAIDAVLREAVARLASVSDTPRLDAELLLAHVLRVEQSTLAASLSLSKGCPSLRTAGKEGQGFDRLSQSECDAYEHLLSRRLAREPVAYITGTRGFWSIDLDVTRDVLIPRPDSETLIEAAVAHFGKAGPRRVLDLGTGSGALLLAALAQWPTATGLGVDAPVGALAVARGNGARIAPERASFVEGDWGRGIDERFDLVLCNPPYVETGAQLMRDVVDYEPHAALFAGRDGLDDYRRLMPQFAALLAPGGIVALEVGHSLATAVTALARAQGFTVELRRDLGGRDRCLVLSAAAHK